MRGPRALDHLDQGVLAPFQTLAVRVVPRALAQKVLSVEEEHHAGAQARSRRPRAGSETSARHRSGLAGSVANDPPATSRAVLIRLIVSPLGAGPLSSVHGTSRGRADARRRAEPREGQSGRSRRDRPRENRLTHDRTYYHPSSVNLPHGRNPCAPSRPVWY
jgi:hypothetical protein